MNYSLSYPAINGETVTEGHAAYCAKNGHAAHKVDGVELTHCPRCGSVKDNSNDDNTEDDMRTYAEYLTSLTVKTLNVIAKGMKLKGYSKLRKPELVAFIDKAIEADWDVAHVHAPKAEIIDGRSLELINDGMGYVHSEAAITNHPQVAELHRSMTAKPSESAPKAVFSCAPKATMAKPEIKAEAVAEVPSLDDLKDAYRNLSRTVRNMGGKGAEGMRRVKYVGRLRKLSAQLKAMGISNPATI